MNQAGRSSSTYFAGASSATQGRRQRLCVAINLFLSTLSSLPDTYVALLVSPGALLLLSPALFHAGCPFLLTPAALSDSSDTHNRCMSHLVRRVPVSFLRPVLLPRGTRLSSRNLKKRW